MHVKAENSHNTTLGVFDEGGDLMEEPNSAPVVHAASSLVQVAPAALETASAPGATPSRTAPAKKGKAPVPWPKNKGKAMAIPIDVDAEARRLEDALLVRTLRSPAEA